MRIPESFKSILEKNQLYYGIVMTTLSQYEGLIRDRRPDFFPDYTDHGITHIENVLFTTEWLIGESIELLNDRDITVLILAVLLHDYGMFITQEGLTTLIDSNIIDEDFDNTTWSQLWAEYKDETRRWDDKRQILIAGRRLDTHEIILDGDLKLSIRKVIGEFLRWHHPRLGFEISKYGFPGVKGQMISFADGLENEIKDLAGIVARSHGMSLRDTFQYMEEKFFSIREPHSVKAVYLMILLRIADYLQITAERASKKEMYIRDISSPFSRLQWNIHNAVKNIGTNNHDPELIKVVAVPGSTEEYLELNKLFRGIQYELDTSWAVLGEIYGENDELSKLKIKIRRISSNIEDKKFISQLPFIPIKVSFESHPEVMKLLIQPLYGNNPSFGVRELLQNALDACRERMDKEKDSLLKYEPVINIIIEEQEKDNYYFTISDNGLGMSKDILLNYFLKAGSTYRKSIEWNKEFTDDQGQSRIQRSGKFGVGVLAAFLIGEEIYVETKKAGTNDSGYYFSAKLDDDVLEIRKKPLDPGTIIRIKMKEEAVKSLREETKKFSYSGWYNWFKFSYPKINLTVPSGWKIPRIQDKEIDIENSQIKGWHRFYPENYFAVDWSYSDSQQLLCNGIIIPQYKKMVAIYPSFEKGPAISVLDLNGNFPLSLNRNEINSQLPFRKELITEICKQILWALFQLPDINSTQKNKGYIGDIIRLKHDALSGSTDSPTFKWGEGDLLLTKSGYILPHSYCIGKSKIKKIVAMWVKDIQSDILSLIPFNDERVAYSILPKLSSLTSIKKRLYESVLQFDNKKFHVNKKRVYLPANEVNYLTGAKRRLAQWFKDVAHEEQVIKGWSCLSIRNPSLTDIYENELNVDIIQLIVEYNTPKEFSVGKTSNGIMSEVLQNFLGDNVIIPYSMEERKKLFPKVFQELSKFK